MAINLNVLSARLRQSREALAYDLEEASRASGIPADKLIAIEGGNTKPSGDEILILATLYDCDFLQLIDERLPAPSEKTEILYRRHGDSFSPKDRRAVQEFLYLCQAEANLEATLGKTKSRPQISWSGTNYKTHGRQAAEQLRRAIGYRPNEVGRDIYTDFRAIGVHIFRRELENNEISGLYIEDPIAGHCVLINYNEDIYRQRFSTAHEVAHSIFDSSDGIMVTYEARSSKYSKNDFIEIRANSFASHYLMPLTMLNALPKLDEESAAVWAQQFRVSTPALSKALKDAGIIDAETAIRLRSIRVPQAEKIDPEAPEGLTENQRERRLGLLKRGLSDYYVELCRQAHDKEIISIHRLCELLRIESDDLAEFGKLFGWTIKHGL